MESDLDLRFLYRRVKQAKQFGYKPAKALESPLVKLFVKS